MAVIRTLKGHEILVDDEDLPLVDLYVWFADIRRNCSYARANTVTADGRKTTILMHKLILQNVPEIDHKDGNGLNNQKDNLRPCTRQQNHFNKRKTNGSSRFKGVSIVRKTGQWAAHIRINRHNTFLGAYSNEEDAARSYDAAAKENFGEFARTNF